MTFCYLLYVILIDAVKFYSIMIKLDFRTWDCTIITEMLRTCYTFRLRGQWNVKQNQFQCAVTLWKLPPRLPKAFKKVSFSLAANKCFLRVYFHHLKKLHFDRKLSHDWRLGNLNNKFTKNCGTHLFFREMSFLKAKMVLRL